MRQPGQKQRPRYELKLTIPPEEIAALKAAAKADGRSIANFTANVLRKALKRKMAA